MKFNILFFIGLSIPRIGNYVKYLTPRSDLCTLRKDDCITYEMNL
jgi:hypothetical protein